MDRIHCFLLLTTLGLLTAGVDCRRCYKCDSTVDRACSGTRPPSHFQRECRRDLNYCNEKTGYRNSELVVIRDCAYENENTQGTVMIQGEMVDVQITSCKTDLCNARTGSMKEMGSKKKMGSKMETAMMASSNRLLYSYPLLLLISITTLLH